jgi:hypothetical protein
MASPFTNACGCSCSPRNRLPQARWIIGSVSTPEGPIPRIATAQSWRDRLGGWRARWGYRDQYRILPGLYAVGKPSKSSTILVTANYKLTFDQLRKELGGIDAWLLVLDTRGINVWCAAGKGVFSTREVARMIEATPLRKAADSRTLVLPQLAAPGVSAHQIKKDTGYSVVFGPVQARDIPRFLENGMKASPEMRSVQFPLWGRLAVVPVELVSAMKYFLIYLSVAALTSSLSGKGSLSTLALLGIPVLGAILLGIVAVPALLPYLPFRSFTLKGWIPGIVWAGAVSYWTSAGILQTIGNILFLPALSAGLALTYTGSSTFTSQTGVNKEIGLFARPMAISGILGLLLMAVNGLIPH